jgi:hypothetical protein
MGGENIYRICRRTRLGGEIMSERRRWFGMGKDVVKEEPQYRSYSLVGGGASTAAELNITAPIEAYRRVGLVRKCINTTAYFSTRRGFKTACDNAQAKKEVDEINKKVSLGQMIYTSIIKREIYGRASWEILKINGVPSRLVPLRSDMIRPYIDPSTLELLYYTYAGRKLQKDECLFFPNDPLETDYRGESSVTPIMDSIKLKVNLERDLLEAAKRTWGPIGVFQMDTSDIADPVKKVTRMTEFANSLKPGESVVMNRKIEGKIYDLKPDLGALVRSIEKADEEIMGNWGIPKAILAREKTVTKATLEISLKALYEGSIEGQQTYFKIALEQQWYPMLMKSLGYSEDVEIEHIWNPVAIQEPDLIRAMLELVKEKMMTIAEAYALLGWGAPSVGELPSTSVKEKQTGGT